ncbi:MAG: DUF1549 and DUF1553 domain-containing protein [Limisphaera sp.]|nr:DUF1549 and DUF1553 domain-containing protein [Limisphaera sp.]
MKPRLLRIGTAAAWFFVLTARAADPYTASEPAQPRGELDRLVFERLQELGLRPAPPCSDAVFLRRVYLDVIGTLPTAEEVRAFLEDRQPEKHAALIERLLAREEFADYWALKWGDLLRVKAEFPINFWPNAAQAYHRWIRTSLRGNKPYDRFVRELLTASGSNFRDPPVNFYRAVPGRTPDSIARAVALTFMGVRTDRWPSNRVAGLAACFAYVDFKPTGEWKEEIVFHNPASPRADRWVGPDRRAVLPDGTALRLTPEQDPRVAFADWLVRADNPWFTAAIVNRIWAWLLGRGLVHEPDDFRPDNPPVHPAVLQYLQHQLVRAGYDLKHVFRLILNSATYRQSCVPVAPLTRATAHFACYPVRRLEAEVLLDALNQVTGAADSYTSPIPEPFTVMPAGTRAITLPDGSITSPFLELFGRSARDTGLESERNLRSTAAQRLHLLNASQVLRKIEQSPLVEGVSRPDLHPPQVAETLYLTVLSRFPTGTEQQTVARYLQTAGSRREAAVDLVWALINTAEFVHRH